MAERRTAYPELQPYRTGYLPVGDGHSIYFEECGNPRGKPVVMVHGGPGGGSNAFMRRLHDPSVYRIVLFDQRGAGKSTPQASLVANTTWHLVADMEKLRDHLGIDRWQVFGGSWGSTLSIAYAETHPDRVSELILRGIFLLTRREIEWFYQEGASWLFPDAWDRYLEPIPEAERADMIAAYYRRLTGDDPVERLRCARAWSQWEGSTISLLPDEARVARFGVDDFAITFASIECHYFVHGGFMEHDGQLLTNAHRLKDIPGVIVHGRYDVCTPPANAWRLKKVWPEVDLKFIADAGHTMTEPGIVHELVLATDRFRDVR
ncbi:MAG: prolyl aminopeptidase [Hyphomicrobiales bacterium]